MKKEDLTVPAIFAEAIGMILGIVYIGLQIYYGIVYKVAPYKFICNIAGVVLIYVGLSLVSCQPEKINRLPKEVCVGKVRKYSIRMIRLVKLVFIIGLMVPCVGDVIGIELKDAYSLLVIAYSINSITTQDPEMFRGLKEWIQSLKKFSTLISESGEMQRIQFFKQQREIISTL